MKEDLAWGLAPPSSAPECPQLPFGCTSKSTQSEKMVEARRRSEGGPEDEAAGLDRGRPSIGPQVWRTHLGGPKGVLGDLWAGEELTDFSWLNIIYNNQEEGSGA